MSFAVPFAKFTSDVESIPGVDCGVFSYSVAAIAKIPSSPDPVISLAVNSVDLTIESTLDKALIPTGLTAQLSLTGFIVSYPAVTHSQTFEVKVYTFEC